MPGYAPPLDLKISKRDYDPAKHAVMGLRQFLLILHKWIIDEYCQKPHKIYGWNPEQRYLEGTRVFEPEFLDDAKKLDFMFGVVREGVLDHRGVCYENLWFHSDQLEALFLRDAIFNSKRAAVKVKVKVNPNDLSMVHVWDRKLKGWIRCLVDENDREYARGLSLHCHKLYRKHAQENYHLDEPAAYQVARREIRELIAKTLPMDLSLRTNSLIARALGIGTHNIFDNLDINGRLTDLTGPFAGHPLNPFSAAAASAAAIPDAPMVTPSSPAATLRCEPSSVPNTAESPRRAIPTFVTDRSLGKRAR
jgi:putative transposase